MNAVQLAAAGAAYLELENNHRLILVVPPGRGKSRIHAGLTHMLLKNTKEKVFVRFNDQGLLQKDLDATSQLKVYAEN